MVARLLSVLLLLGLSSNLLAGPADARETVRAFFDAWSAADVRAAATYWAAPSSPEFDRRVRRAVTIFCNDVHVVRITGARVLPNGDTDVDAELRLTRTSAMKDAKPRFEVLRPIVRVRRTGDAWRIVGWSSREEQLVAGLVAEQSRDARGNAIDAQSAVWSPELVRLLNWEAHMLIFRSRLPLARELSEYGRRIADDLGDDASRSWALSAASAVERAELRANWKQLAADATEAVAAAQRATDPDALAMAYFRLGRSPATVYGVGDLQQSLGLADLVDDLSVPAMSASQLATHYGLQGDYRLALLHAGFAARYSEAAGSNAALMQAETNYGSIYRALGDPELSSLHYGRAYTLGRELGFARLYVAFVDAYVEVLTASGRDPAALIALVDENLADPGVGAARYGVMNLLTARARLNAARGEFAQAEQDVVDALVQPIAAEYPRPYFALAELRMRQGRPADAMVALDLAPTVWSVPMWALYADAARATGDVDKAMLVASCGIEYVEAAFNRSAVAERSSQKYLGTRYPMEQILVELLVNRGEQKEALIVAEAAKARVLRDAASSTRPAEDPRSQEVIAERALADKVAALNRTILTSRDDKALATLRAELANARLELADLRVRSGARGRGQELYRNASTPSSIIRWPFRDTVALQYMVGERQTIIFAIRGGETPEPRLDVKTVPVHRSEVTALVQQLRDRIAARDLRYQQAATRLYELLVAPVESLIASKKNLCIIPDGELWKVPFHALAARNGKPLLDRVAIFYAPSIQMLNTLHGRPETGQQPRLLALGNPTIHTKTATSFRAYDRGVTRLGELLETETEVNAIARIYGRSRSTVYVRDQAREARFKEEASAFDILHVAAHGLVDDNAPAFSALVLAASSRDDDDGLLEAHEVADLRLNADLVVLSACDTAAGRVGGGEGLLGLSWAFLAAGADGLVGSQWKAPSAATELLMVTFHQRLHAGDSPAEALRQAQRRLLRDDRYASPLDWAPFIVIGDGL